MWRRRESNPRPKTSPEGFYKLSPTLVFALQTAVGHTIRKAIRLKSRCKLPEFSQPACHDRRSKQTRQTKSKWSGLHYLLCSQCIRVIVGICVFVRAI